MASAPFVSLYRRYRPGRFSELRGQDHVVRALQSAMTALARDADLRTRLGAAGAQDVLALNHDAWAEGFSRALSSVGVSARIGSVE